MIPRIGLVAGLSLASLASASIARAQAEPPAVTTLVLHPARAPVPALKYRLLPDRRELVPGNAAVFYHRAIELMLEIRQSEGARKTGPNDLGDEEATSEWITGPIMAIPLDKAHRWLERNRAVLHEVELAARRRGCDWEFDSRPEGFDLMIHEIQWMRPLGRLVALRARIAIREDHLDDAVHWLRTGYAMARHVSQGPILIQSLVGVNCCMMLSPATEDLIQAPGAPSLYWALVDRPHPLLDPSEALEGERFFLEREIPELRELEGLPWSVEKARALTDGLATKTFRLSEWPAPGSVGWGTPETGEWLNRLGLAALVAQAYPGAKRALVARGRPPAQVEAMPAAQVVFLDIYDAYQSYRDDVFKWRNLPLPQASEGLSRSEDSRFEIRGRLLLSLFCSLMVRIQPARMATVRVERRLDALQCVESIRMYLANHGRLPARLEDLADAPVPLDPMTGRPFDYKVEGGRAFLSAPNVPPTSEHSSFGLHYELKPAP